MDRQSGERHMVKTCHTCGGARFYYLFSIVDYRVVRCDDCGLMFLNPQPGERELARAHSANYFLGKRLGSEGRHGGVKPGLGKPRAEFYLSEIRRYHVAPRPGGCSKWAGGDGYFLGDGRGGGALAGDGYRVFRRMRAKRPGNG